MSTNYYHPQTLEHIRSPLPAVADWANVTALPVPEYDPQTHSCRFVEGGWVAAAVPGPDVAELKAGASASIDQAAGVVRQKYITTSPGQEATYTEKARQCEAYKAAAYPATPDPVGHAYVIAEANANSRSYRVACDAILAERDQWAVLGAKIEEARRKSKIAVAAASTAEAVEAALQTGLAELAAL